MTNEHESSIKCRWLILLHLVNLKCCNGRTDNTFPFYLCEVPEPLGGPRNSLTLFQPGSASSAIINEAFRVRQEGGRPQGSELEKPLGGVAGELQHRDNQRVTPLNSV